MNIVNQKTGNTEFHCVVAKGLQKTREFCNGPDFTLPVLEVSNTLKQRPLHLAVSARNYELVKFLLEKGASVDSFKKGDWTSLMVASALSSCPQVSKIIQILLKAEANPRLKNKDGWTAMHLACKSGNLEAVRQLAAVEPSLIGEPSRSKRVSMHIAALHGHTEVTQFLLNTENCSSLCSFSDTCGSTPVLEAVIGGSSSTLDVLSQHVDVKSQVDRYGQNCLHKAAQAGHTHLLARLVELGVDVNGRTSNDGYSPLHFAVSENHEATVVELLRLGADPQLRNDEGFTVFQLRRGLKPEHLLRLIEECSKNTPST